MNELFDPYNVNIDTLQGDGVVDELDYKTLLVLYEDAKKYAELEQTSRKYWSVRAAELSTALDNAIHELSAHEGDSETVHELRQVLVGRPQ